MNVISKILLKFSMLPSGIYRKLGVDIWQLKSILCAKLIMDDRRQPALNYARNTGTKKPVKMATITTMVISFFMGLFFLFAFFGSQDILTQLTYYFSLFFFMLSATIISDFTTVLTDIRDNSVILPKPVNDRTFVVSRILHVFIHISKIIIPMGIPGLIYIGVSYGIAGALIFLPLLLFITLFSIFFINAVYLLIIKFTSPQKFQSVIGYIQILMAISIYGGYQVVPRLMREGMFSSESISDLRGISYYPLYWFAQCWKVIYYLSGSQNEIILSLLALALPVISLLVVIRYLAPAFNKKLGLINSSTGIVNTSSPLSIKRKHSGYTSFLGDLLTKGTSEKMGFLFTWKMSSRSRDFKMRVYPSMGYILVYVIIMVMNLGQTEIEDIVNGKAGKIIILSALYFTSFILITAITQIGYSDKFKAAWIYFISPVAQPGDILLGAAKAVVFKFYIPIVAGLIIAGVSLVGPSLLPNIILGLFNQLLIISVLVYLSPKFLPFSRFQENSQKTGLFLKGLLILMVSFLIAGIHFMIYEITAVVYIFMCLSVFATWMVMGSIRKISWAKLTEGYDHRD